MRWRAQPVRGRARRQLSWGTNCTRTSDGTAAPGSRTLTSAELAGVRTAIQAVQVSARTACGADKQTLTLTVFQGDDQMVYGDDFYACLMSYAHYVETTGLDALTMTFATLATN